MRASRYVIVVLCFMFFGSIPFLALRSQYSKGSYDGGTLVVVPVGFTSDTIRYLIAYYLTPFVKIDKMVTSANWCLEYGEDKSSIRMVMEL